MNELKPEILVHMCCAPDATAVVERLHPEYSVTGYFHNPNIHPESEFKKRLVAVGQVSSCMGVPVITTDYKPEPWLHAMHGMEREPEKGRRCQACFLHNLRATARKAKEMDIPWFTTSLTVSPHKVAADVFTAGQTASRETGVQFLAEDFKKRDGFKRSLELSNQMHLYRQKYCGCLFSLRVGDPV